MFCSPIVVLGELDYSPALPRNSGFSKSGELIGRPVAVQTCTFPADHRQLPSAVDSVERYSSILVRVKLPC